MSDYVLQSELTTISYNGLRDSLTNGSGRNETIGKRDNGLTKNYQIPS